MFTAFSDEIVPRDLAISLYKGRSIKQVRKDVIRFKSAYRKTRDKKALTRFGDRKRSSYRPTRNR